MNARRRYIPRLARLLAIAILPVTAGFANEPDQREIGGVRYHVVTAAPARVRLMWADDQGRPLRTFAALSDHLAARKLNADLLMNGGIFEPGGIPSGLYVQDGRELRPVNRRAGEGNFFLLPNGIFFLTPDRAGVVDTAGWPPQAAAIRDAVQSGPLLLRRGEIHPAFRKNSESRLLRNGVGVSRDGKVVLAITDYRSPRFPNLFEFAQLFRSLGCDDALFLDGDISQIRRKGEFHRPGGQFASFIVVLTQEP